MVVGFLLAAAVSSAAAKPLFVPPKGMVSISADANVRYELAHMHGTFVREYRGFVKVKPSWSGFTYKMPETIVIATHPTSVNASEWGATVLDNAERVTHVMPQMRTWCAKHRCGTIQTDVVKRLASQPVALCNGERGWLTAFTRSNDTYEEVFARSGNRMYSAVLRFQTDPGDGLRGARTLRTLCPPNVGELRAAATAVPFAVPAGWMRSTNTASAFPELSVLGEWYHVSPKALVMDHLMAATTSDVSEYTTPEQMAASWKAEMKQSFSGVRITSDRATKLCSGADAWLTVFQTQDALGRTYSIENMYAYGSDNLYVVQYSHAANTPEDPAAHKALYSLCPPQSQDALR